MESESAGRQVLQHLQQSDFEQGKRHIVAKLRNMVAEHVAGFAVETLLELPLGFVQLQRIGGFRDGWNPQEVLETSGFGFLLDAETVSAVGANEDGEATDIIVSYVQGNEVVLKSVSHGVDKLEILRTRLK